MARLTPHRSRRMVVSLALAGLLAFSFLPGPSYAVGTLTITSNTMPIVISDSNGNPPGPSVFAAQAKVCNTGTDPLTDVIVKIGDGMTAGTFPVTTHLGQPYRLRLLDEVVNNDVSDGTRVLGGLAAGACTYVFWQLEYPRPNGVFNFDLNWTVWGTAIDPADPLVSRTGSTTDVVSVLSVLSTSANKIAPQGSSQTVSSAGPYSIGQTVTYCLNGVEFGIIGDGERTPGVNDFSFQPVGSADFNPDNWQLVKTTSSLSTTKCGNDPYNYTNETYYSTVDDGDWTPPPGVEACAANSQDITGDYCYTFVAIGSGSSTLKPYQQASSGNSQKYNDDFGDITLTVNVNQGCSIGLVKSGSPANVLSGDTLTYTVNYTNTTAHPVGEAPATLTITDAIPTSTTYQNGTASCPTGVACTVYYSTDGTTFTQAQPAGTITHLRFIMNARIAASGTGSVRYSVTVNTNAGVTSGVATSTFDGGATCSSSGTVSTTPVTLAYFKADRRGSGVRIEWTTSTEMGNIGFNLYEVTPAGPRRLNNRLIVSHRPSSLVPQDYVFTARNVTGKQFLIEDVSTFAERRQHGPFDLGRAMGARAALEPVNWGAIQAEHEGLSVRREAVAKAQLAALLDRATPGDRSDGVLAADAIQAAPPAGTKLVRLEVVKDGLARVTYESLLAAGFDLAGLKSNNLAVVGGGQPVPIRVVSGASFGPGSYVEFYGQANGGLYTHKNVYDLVYDSSLRRSIATVRATPPNGVAPVPYYMETALVDNNRSYDASSPTNDPWYDDWMFTYTTPLSKSRSIAVDHYVVGAAPASLSVGVWGVTDWPANPDHHLVVDLNGAAGVIDRFFDGNQAPVLNVQLPDGALAEGSNTLTLTLPGDSGVAYETVNLDRFSVAYPRAFMARDGSLTFTAAGSLIQVNGLPSADVVVYRFDATGPVLLDSVSVVPAGGAYRAAFAGTTSAVKYIVSTAGAVQTPGLVSAYQPGIVSPTATDYLIISHPSFIDGLQPLVQYHTNRGLRVKTVDVRDVYERYNFGVVDPSAVKDYVKDAYAAGVHYVLLVGGDTYDYFNYTGSGSMSFVPSLYARTDRFVNYAPVDPAFADVDDDGAPDLAIGRFPVRTAAELSLLVNKTLAYAGKNYGQTAVLAADNNDGALSFVADSESFANSLTGWAVTRAYLPSGLSQARTNLLAKLNEGVALTSYAGHSGLGAWTFAGLFRSSDARTLTNAGRPTMVLQWGCWNTYHVMPAYNTLGHAFLLSGDRGAAAVLGASSLTESTSEEKLGRLVFPRAVTPGKSIGDAVQEAKAELAETDPLLADVLLGWTLLGDPALVVEP